MKKIYIKKRLMLLCLAGSVIFLGGCVQDMTDVVDTSSSNNVVKEVSFVGNQQEKSETFVLETVSPDAFEQALQDENRILIDVRTAGELEETGVLRTDVINIDFYASDFREKLDQLDKNAQYLIYCRSGNRSGKTLKMMRDLGFSNVLDLSGGIKQRKAQGKRTFVWDKN